MKVTSERENAICDLADRENISYGEVERILYPPEKPKRKSLRSAPRERKPRVRKPKEPCYSYARVIRIAMAAGSDCAADNPDMQMEDACYDIADCLLYDDMIYKAMKKQLSNRWDGCPSRQTMKEILADYIHDGGMKQREKQAKKKG